MGFTLFKLKRSASTKKQGTANEAVRPHTSHGMSSPEDRPSLFPNPLALNPPNRLHWTPQPHGIIETTRVLSGDISAAAALSETIGRADRLSKTVPDLNLGGLGATERWLKTSGADRAAVDELLYEQRRAEARLHILQHRRTRALGRFPLMTDESLAVLPATTFQASTSQRMSRRSSFDIVFEDSLADLLLPETTTTADDVPVDTTVDGEGCDACKACFEKCSTCYAAHETGCDMCRRGLCNVTALAAPRNPSAALLARLDKRPAPLTRPSRPVSISASLLTPTPDAASAAAAAPLFGSALWHDPETLASLGGKSTEEDEDEDDEDVVEICEVQLRDIACIVKPKVVDIAAKFPHVKPLTITVPASMRLAVPSTAALEKGVKNFSLPLKRPDSPTLPAAFPAPLFSKRY